MLSEKLVIVDDQGDLRKMLRISMGYGKYQIFEAEEGEAALNVIRAERPNVVLLDVMMPGKYDGFEVCELIKQDPELAATFVVLITARSNQKDFLEGKRVGADAYVVKPFRLARLIEVVEQRKTLNEAIFAYAD